MDKAPLSVATISFCHKKQLPYTQLEVWVNRELPLSKKGEIKRKAANDFIARVMAARDIVGLAGDYALICLWKRDSMWKCFSKTKVSLQPLMHLISGVNTDDPFSKGEEQLLDSTLVLKDIKLSNFRLA